MIQLVLAGFQDTVNRGAFSLLILLTRNLLEAEDLLGPIAENDILSKTSEDGAGLIISHLISSMLYLNPTARL